MLNNLNKNQILESIDKKIKNEEELEKLYFGKYYFYKENKKDKLYQVDHIGYIGELLFSFDKKTIYNLWEDYPTNMTGEEIKILNKEQPYWANFFKSRN